MKKFKAFRFWILVAVIVAVFVGDITIVPREIVMIPSYFIVVVLAAAFARPGQVVAIYIVAMVLGVMAGFRSGLLPGLDCAVRLIGLFGVA